jgi:predicted nuclease of predicted toxin-antitoxin system
MRFLLDMPVSPGLADWLAAQGHDALHAATAGLQRASDRELLRRAADEGRLIVTADTDFPQLLALSAEATPGIILFRGGNYTAAEMRQLLQRVLQSVPEQTLARSICVVDRSRIRCRPLPLH